MPQDSLVQPYGFFNHQPGLMSGGRLGYSTVETPHRLVGTLETAPQQQAQCTSPLKVITKPAELYLVLELVTLVAHLVAFLGAFVTLLLLM